MVSTCVICFMYVVCVRVCVCERDRELVPHVHLTPCITIYGKVWYDACMYVCGLMLCA